MSGIRSRLRDVRLVRGLTQQALARSAGLTRQTVGAIEAGDYGPSLEVALRLARALDVPLDDIFALAAETAPDASLLPAPGTTRVLAGRVGGREVLRGVDGLGAYRWPAAAADGVAVVDDAGAATWRRYGEPHGENLFLAGCDAALGLLADHLWAAGLRAFWFEAGSAAARTQLMSRRTHLAGVHWTEADTPPQVPDGTRRIELSRWQMGFVLLASETRFHGTEDLGVPGLRIVNRERGAGARSLMDAQLAAAGVDAARVQGYGRELSGHWDVANAVAQGAADVGIASGPAAAAFSLAFLPLGVETSEIWWQPGDVMEDAIARVGGVLASAAFRHDLGAFGPFDTSGTGRSPAAGQRGRG